MSLVFCECGRVSATSNLTTISLRCSECPSVEQAWWFRLDEWCHRHLPRWAHRPLCAFVERRLWGVHFGSSEQGGTDG